MKRFAVLSVISLFTLGHADTPTSESPYYVNPDTQVREWVEANPDDEKASALERIANQPTANWVGDWTEDIEAEVAAYTNAAEAVGKIPVLVAYNIPGRDCGNFSSGGAGNPEAYQEWISDFATGLEERQAIIILEPDALPLLPDCEEIADEGITYDLLSYAVDTFAELAPNAQVYIDAGNAAWLAPEEVATRLQNAGVERAAGFALNTSNYHSTEKSEAYGDEVVAAIGAPTRFVVDSSRNGVGAPPDDEWCNPAGRKIGETPRSVKGDTGLEHVLWVKRPGESDGDCGVGEGTNAGEFMPEAAFDMTQ